MSQSGMGAIGFILARGGEGELINVLIVAVIAILAGMAKLLERIARKAAERKAEDEQLRGRTTEEAPTADLADLDQEETPQQRPATRYPPMPQERPAGPVMPRYGIAPRPVPPEEIPPASRPLPPARVRPAVVRQTPPMPRPAPKWLEPVFAEPEPVTPQPVAPPPRRHRAAAHKPAVMLTGVQLEIQQLQERLRKLEAVREQRLAAVSPAVELEHLAGVVSMRPGASYEDGGHMEPSIHISLDSEDDAMSALVHYEVFSPPKALRTDRQIWDF